MGKKMNNGLKVVGMLLIFLALVHLGATPVPAAEPKGTLKMAIHWSPSRDWVDPAIAGFSGGAFTTQYMYHDALVKAMSNDLYSPCLAESWTISPDFTVYEFTLRKGVKFHNGMEMTAEDAVFSFKRYKGGRSTLILGKTEKVEVVSPYVFRITFKEPFINFLDYFLVGTSTVGFVLPKQYLEKVGDAGFRKNPIGAGPYKFVEWEPGVRIVGEAFKDYWRKVPNVKRIELLPTKELATRYAMVKRGEVDLATLMIDVFYEKVKKDPELQMFHGKSPTIRMIYLCKQWDPKSPWSDVRVRKAASLAVDRQSLVEIHAPGAGPASTLGLTTHPQTLPRKVDPYDPEQAKKLLAEAGYPNGFHGGKFVPRNGAYYQFGEQVFNYWRAIGIKMDMVVLDRTAFAAQRRAGRLKDTTFQGILMHAMTADRINYLLTPPYWRAYPDIDALLAKYNKSLDLKERDKLIKQVQQLLYDKRVFISLTGASCPIAGSLRIDGDPCKIKGPLPIWFPAPMEDIKMK